MGKVERPTHKSRCSSMVECLPSKQKTRVRFPLPGPDGQVAQLAVQLICNQQVAGSIPVLASICGCSSVGRAFDCHSKGRGFKSRQPLQPSFPRERQRRIQQLFGIEKWLIQLSSTQSMWVQIPLPNHAPRSVLERNPPLNKPGGHDFD